MTVPLGSGAEFDRIRAIADVLGPRSHGLGHDCALVPFGSETLALSTDLTVENVHFRLDWVTLEEAAWRAAAAALSDLAATGALPIGILTSIAVPPGGSEPDLKAIAAGFAALLEETGGRVLGGDLSAGPAWIMDVTVVGTAGAPVLRSGARPGDGVWVTGTLGGSRAAVHAWQAGLVPPAAARERFARTRPRLAAGAWLAGHGARAMMDLSDGLAGDVRHLAAASKTGIQLDLDLLPIDQAVHAVAGPTGADPLTLAASGGEDYELLVVLPDTFGDSDAAALARDTGTGLTRIGRVQGDAVVLLRHGTPVTLDSYQHFR